MKRNHLPFLIVSLLVVMALACGSSAPTAAPQAPTVPAAAPTQAAPATPTPNVQATVNAAIAATAQAQNVTQATVNAAVASTVVALPPTATPPPPVQSDTLSQEEMEALITQAVNEAVAAANQADAAASQAAADDAMTNDEVQAVQVYVTGATQAAAYAEELLVAYSQVYGDLAGVALEEANQVSQDLNEITTSMDALSASLQQMTATLQQGQAIATETINQFEAAAQAASQNLDQAQAHTQQMAQMAQQSRDELAAQIQNMKPNNVPSDLQSTLQGAFSFVDQVRGMLEGGQKPSRDQILQIAQLGANVSAGMSQHGGPKLQGLSGKFGEVSMNLGRGQFPQAHKGVGGLESSLGARPAGVPSRPGGGGGGGSPGIRP